MNNKLYNLRRPRYPAACTCSTHKPLLRRYCVTHTVTGVTRLYVSDDRKTKDFSGTRIVVSKVSTDYERNSSAERWPEFSKLSDRDGYDYRTVDG